MQTVGIIPARLASSRLPRKVILAETGKPLIQYVWEAACAAKLLDEVIVATDSKEVAQIVTGFGGKVVLTGEHPSGTDRVAEAVQHACPDAQIVINLQGDEPEIDPQQIDELARTLIENPMCDMATLATPIQSLDDLEDRSCTKVVCAQDGRALYFSRLPVPYARDDDAEDLLQADSPWLLHLGLYAYRVPYLLQLSQLPPSPLEQLEKLEQLRALESGGSIQVRVVPHHAVGIDTPDDYARFVERTRRRAA